MPAIDRDTLGGLLERKTGLRVSPALAHGWIGLECPSVSAALWMMCALVAASVLSRREGSVLFLPVNPATGPTGAHVSLAITRICQLAEARASSSAS